jgi:hypothetical protein
MTIHDVISHVNNSSIKDSGGEYMCMALCSVSQVSHTTCINLMEARNDADLNMGEINILLRLPMNYDMEGEKKQFHW